MGGLEIIQVRASQQWDRVFTTAGSVVMGIVKPLCPWFPTGFFSPRMERDSPEIGAPCAWLRQALGDFCQTQAVPALSVLSSDGTGKRYGCYKSQITL